MGSEGWVNLPNYKRFDVLVMHKDIGTIRLIINADDYGYFKCVSQGILEGASDGLITATGIMANGPDFEKHIEWLEGAPELDLGVHLNITHGRPLSSIMSDYLRSDKGIFPGKFTIIKDLVSGRLKVKDVADEWRAQITRCIQANIKLRFLNSHEHLHMFPPLYKATIKLAQEFGIPHVRFSTPEWTGSREPGTILRNILMHGMSVINRRWCLSSEHLEFLGMNQSGKLSIAYMQSIFPRLQSGTIYELMCHPGHYDSDEITDPNLLAYHRWQSELDLLKSKELSALCSNYGIEVVGYGNLPES